MALSRKSPHQEWQEKKAAAQAQTKTPSLATGPATSFSSAQVKPKDETKEERNARMGIGRIWVK